MSDYRVEYIECSCHSSEHLIKFAWFEDDPELYLGVYLYTYTNFFKRLWIGLKYAFGYRSRFGDWDEFIVNVEDADKIINLLQNLKQRARAYGEKLQEKEEHKSLSLPPGLRNVCLNQKDAQMIKDIIDDSNYPSSEGKEMPNYGSDSGPAL